MKNSEMLNNLYKILRMNIILAKSNGDFVSEDTIQSFDDTAKKIDDDSNNKYENEVNKFYYATKTLDEESERLENLVNLIDKRLDDRNELLSDYFDVTGRKLEPLGYIKDEDKVEDYRVRLNDIRTYLSNKENISKIEEELDVLHKDLDKCFEEKKVDEENNSVLESDLLQAFKDALVGTNYSDVVNVVDIDYELEKLKPEVDEQLKTLNTFDSAYNNLLRAGISRDSENEYASYVNDAKKVYYKIKEREFLYCIYKIILDSKRVYSDLFTKRDMLDNVLEDRLKLRAEMSIVNDDIMLSLYNVIDKQNKIIVKEKNVIDNINEIDAAIDFKEKRLNELKDDNRRVEILSLLQEFGIIDTYNSEDTLNEFDNVDNNNREVEENVDKVDEKIEDNKSVEEAVADNVDLSIPNMVVQVKEAYPNFNVTFARSKADTVMRRVGKSLGYAQEPKKDSIVSFDFKLDTNNNEIKNQDIVTNKVEEQDKPVNNSLSNLNLDDLNLNLKLDNRNVDDEKISDFNNSGFNPIFPDIEPSNNSEVSNKPNAVENQIDRDFWSAEEDKEIFPNVLANNNVTINKDESGFKLGSPINIGGYDENRN